MAPLNCILALVESADWVLRVLELRGFLVEA